MKVCHSLLVACAGVALVVIVFLGVSAYREHKQIPFLNAPRLIGGLQVFLRDQTAAGRQLPSEVSLQDLLRGGYITTNDVRAFDGMEVIFSTQTDAPHLQMILARARTPDGQFICLLADGSVQQFTAWRLKDALEKPGQQIGAAKRSRPIRPETNPAQATTAPAGDAHAR